MNFDIQTLAAAIASPDFYRRDPLKYQKLWVHQKALIDWVRQDVETYLRAPNKCGKTVGGACLGVGMARGLKEIDGIPLPRVRVPNVGYLVVRGHAQGTDSALAAYDDALGLWPHTRHKVGGVGISHYTVATEKCSHGMGEECSTCSRIVVFVDRGIIPQGVRIDWAHADEPPSQDVWDEMRQRDRADAPLYRWITATPIRRVEWEWLREDFKDYGKDSWEKPVRHKMVIIGRLEDNKALSAKKIARMHEDASTSPWERARLYGEYVDVDGESPFLDYVSVLDRWRKSAWEGTINQIAVSGDREGQMFRLPLEVWWAPERDERYLMTVDCSEGIPDEKHDPAGVHVYAVSRPRLVARFGARFGIDGSGYAASHLIGGLAAGVGRMYGTCPVEVERNGWGLEAISTMRRLGYPNISREKAEDRAGVIREVEGFRTTTVTRPLYIGAVQRVLEESVHEDSIIIPSLDVVRCLEQVTMDEDGKVLGEGKVHDEDLILLGKGAHTLSRIGKGVRPVGIAQTPDIFKVLGMKQPGPDPWQPQERW